MTRRFPPFRPLALSLVVASLTGCTTLAGVTGDRVAATTAQMSGNGTGGGIGGMVDAMGGTREAARPGGVPQQGGGLKGGEVDDNADFGKYLAYLAAYRGGSVAPVDVSQRYRLRVVDEASRSVPNALVTIRRGSETVFSASTTSAGGVLFFPRAFGPIATADYALSVSKGGVEATASLPVEASGNVEVRLPMRRGAIAPRLDVCFVLDVTGSMGDELSRIQRTIRDLSARIQGLPGEPVVRYGLVAYRDRGSDFVTKVGDFTTSLDTFQGRLDGLTATGGGDYPEAVNEALSFATHGVSWDTGESLRLMFVIGDAPPHMDYAQDVPYSTTMLQAAGKGIKIFPLAASGLDDAGEYVFRQLAQVTSGKFLFITYGGTTTHDVGPVQENNLDDLVLGIVRTELMNLDY